MLSVIGQPDPRDMTAWNTLAPDLRIGLEDGVAGLRMAWSPGLGHVTTLDPQVEKAAAAAAQVFADLGAIVETVDPGIPDTKQQIKAFWGAISSVVVDGIPPQRRDELDQDFRRLAEDARRYSLADYVAAYQGRAELAETMRRFHERYDLLLTPQMPIGALEAGRVTPADGSFGDEWINWSPYTYPFNLTQQPAASVPCGFTADGLPIGLQIVGPARSDHLVLRAARAFESARPFATLHEPKK
jgi:aspartyl-tRNA(Asn)/glutamyl-tRNA(Gln) amidotransferase subunit A